MSYRGRTSSGCAIAGWLLLATGCTGGTETGNPPFVAALSYTGTSSAPEAYGVREGGRVATIQRAWLNLDAVRLSTEGTCGGEGQPVEIPALGVGDHAAGAHVETSFEAQPSRFCRLTLPFSRTTRLPEGAPEELRGRSLLLIGQLADGTPFTVASSAEPSLELIASSDGIPLSSEQATLLLAFDFAAWLRELPLDDAVRDGDVIRIDDEHNPTYLSAFEASLGNGVDLYRDGDGDGSVDDGARPLARAR